MGTIGRILGRTVEIGAVASERGITAVILAGGRSARRGEGHGTRAESLRKRAERQLAEYARGERKRFALPLDLAGLSAFESDVFRALARVPWGETVTYGELAALAGHPGKARAVGRAVGRNPLPIVVPCHRVVAANGLGGWSGPPGLKERLLAHEGIALPPAARRTVVIGGKR